MVVLSDDGDILVRKIYDDYMNHYHIRYLEAGVPLKTVSVLLGHTQLQLTTDLYMHVTQEALFDGVELYKNKTQMG